MARRVDNKVLPLRDIHTCLDRKVNLFAVILDFGFPKPTKGTDYCSSIRIIDETHHNAGMAVNIFASDAAKLPHVAALGDVIKLCNVVVKAYGAEVNAVFNKKFSSFALYKGKDGDDFVPYQVSLKFCPRDEDKVYLEKLRKWLPNFQPSEDSSYFPMFKEIKGGNNLNLACKILHCCEVAKDEWFIFAWDGTDTPPNAISSKLEDEVDSPLPLQLEPSALPKELLCTFPAVGSILRITSNLGVEKNHLHLLSVGKWVKLVNMQLEVHAGLWRGVFTPFSKLRYTSNEDSLIVERQRLSDERLSVLSGKVVPCSFPKPSCITEVNHVHDRETPVTLMSVLTHSQVTLKFKCIVRVVAAMPCEAEDLCSPAGVYRIRLTLEDSTARIHVFVVAEDGVTLFDGYPDIDQLKRKLNSLLGVAECDAGPGVKSAECGTSTGVKDAPRNPPWVCVHLMSYNVSGTRCFKIVDTKIVGDT
ncbi:protection of telomeres protein 1b [Cajanus cajan]|uniref:protection of telomeres protein 1b n=1 Tax=Cajanus cajan TaxID=3821 RepID=UPI00098DB209|nr:protection of telomeres protein 1b [Cajanus cajan]